MTGPTASRFFLGVDGGGTKTRFALTEERKLIGEATFGTTYHPDVGVDGVREVLVRGIARVLADAGIDAARLAYAFFGLPAHGEDSAVTPALDALPRSILGHDRFAVGNDMVCGWAGSLAAEDGINIVAGTGSIGDGQRGSWRRWRKPPGSTSSRKASAERGARMRASTRSASSSSIRSPHVIPQVRTA